MKLYLTLVAVIFLLILINNMLFDEITNLPLYDNSINTKVNNITELDQNETFIYFNNKFYATLKSQKINFEPSNVMLKNLIGTIDDSSIDAENLYFDLNKNEILFSNNIRFQNKIIGTLLTDQIFYNASNKSYKVSKPFKLINDQGILYGKSLEYNDFTKMISIKN